MDLSDLDILMDVARRGSFAAVARARQIEPSSISRAIGGLEAQLGFRLFQRTTRRITLTEAGRVYVARLSGLLDDLEAARDDAATINDQPVGTLRLTTSVAFGVTCIVPLLEDFKARFPKLKLDLVLSDSNLDIVAESIDLAVRLAPSLNRDIIATKLMDMKYYVVATQDYIVRAGAPAKPIDLRDHKCIRFALPHFRDQWQFRDAAGRIEQVPVSGDFVMSNAYSIYVAAKRGLGPALLPDFLVAPDLADGSLMNLFPKFEVAAADFNTAAWLLYPSRTYLPSKVRGMINFLKQRVPARCALC
jgi:DNA-binding transcriptional LysR family regulator